MWDCGRRAVELGDRVIRTLWWEAVVRLARDGQRRERVIEMAGRVVQYASLLDSPGTEQTWQRLLREMEPAEPRDQAVVVRVGASALLVGHVSMALLVARCLPAEAWPRAAGLYDRPEMLEYESVSDKMYGHLLGPQADLALNEFVRFGKAVAEHVS
jgi:hypothetical protein